MNIYQEELELHARLLEQWGLEETDVDSAEVQPACFTYTHFLSAIVHTRPFHEGIAPVPERRSSKYSTSGSLLWYPASNPCWDVLDESPWCHAGVAAVLPCYWIYQHVGQYLKGKGSVHEKYQAWIDVYGGEEFDNTVRQVLDMMNTIATTLTVEQKMECKKHFVSASRMEYMFWDAPYHSITWPC